ncbi:MAG TPA: DUF4402 domain-containing protein [Gammaproteobacteria bacterium]
MKPASGVVKGCLALLLSIAPTGALPFEVVNTQEIAFGAIVSGPLGGTVTVTPAGSRSCSVSLTCLAQSPAHPARFTVSGDPSMNFVISLPLTATLSDGAGNTMLIDNFEDSLGGTGMFNTLGQASFTVGGTLNVEPGQAASGYSGSFTVTVMYQ